MTQNITERIALYHNLFFACLLISLACLVLAVALFFMLDIADVISFLTGRKAKRQIEQLSKESAANGHFSAAGAPRLQKAREARNMEAEKGRRAAVTEELAIYAGSSDVFEIERELLLIHTDESIS